MPPTLLFFLKMALIFQGLLWLHMFQHFLFLFLWENAIEILIEVALNLQIIWVIWEFFLIKFFFSWLCCIFIAVFGLSQVMASRATFHYGTLVSHCGVFSCHRALALSAKALEVVAHGLICTMACSIFLNQGLNLCPLHWQVILNHCTTREVLHEDFNITNSFNP